LLNKIYYKIDFIIEKKAKVHRKSILSDTSRKERRRSSVDKTCKYFILDEGCH